MLKAIKVEVKISIVERTTQKRTDDDDGFFRQRDDKFQFAGRISVSARYETYLESRESNLPCVQLVRAPRKNIS